MHIWLDDQHNDPEMPKRWPPPGFTPVRNLAELSALIDSTAEAIEIMDFDHDLGDFDENGNERDGYMIIKWLAHEHLDRYPREVRVHSQNIPGRENIIKFDEFVRKYLITEAR